jgi:hypothetical protein
LEIPVPSPRSSLVAKLPVLAGVELVRVGIAIVRGPAFQRVGNKHVTALHPDLPEQLLQQLAGLADERQTL